MKAADPWWLKTKLKEKLGSINLKPKTFEDAYLPLWGGVEGASPTLACSSTVINALRSSQNKFAFFFVSNKWFSTCIGWVECSMTDRQAKILFFFQTYFRFIKCKKTTSLAYKLNRIPDSSLSSRFTGRYLSFTLFNHRYFTILIFQALMFKTLLRLSVSENRFYLNL